MMNDSQFAPPHACGFAPFLAKDKHIDNQRFKRKIQDIEQRRMDTTYQSHGVTFRYPGEWELTEEQTDEQLSITVSSPLTAFWTLILFPDCPEPEDVVETALEAFHQEYSEMDEYPSQARVGRRATIGRDIDFVCLDVLNLARVRAFRTTGFTALVLFQLTEAEQDETGPILEMITRSLSLPSPGKGEAERHDDEEEE
jgi:hypothetical protein